MDFLNIIFFLTTKVKKNLNLKKSHYFSKMTTIRDDEIFEKLKLLQGIVDGINIKTKESILKTSETKESSTDIIKPYVLYLIYCSPIIISGLVVYLLIQKKTDIVMSETKIDDFLTKRKISYYKIGVITLIICFFIYFIIFLLRNKLNQFFTVIPENPE